MPGARSRCVETTKLSAVAIVEKPLMNTATAAAITCPCAKLLEYGS